MKEKVINILKIISTFLLAILFISMAFYSYRNSIYSFYYMTFLGNFVAGIFLLVVGILYLFRKQIPQFLILCFTILMLLIMGVEIALQEFNIEDGMLFLHFLNPALMFIYYLIFSNQTKTKWPLVFTVLVMPVLYMIFAFIFGACTGDYVYYYLDFSYFGVGNTILFILGVGIGLIAIGFGIYYLNRVLHKHILKDI